jgi:tripartite-type tricarboxylate transporter receptor subunit TctC
VGPIAVLAGAVVVSILHASIAAAQPYPSKAVRVITSNGAGGTSDIFVRALGDELQRNWLQPLVIENRPGGGMNIAGRACAEAPNDGYTFCILPGETLVLNQLWRRNICKHCVGG